MTLAAELVALRRAGKRRDFMQAELPADLGGSYRTAMGGVSLTGRPVAAWKLGASSAGTRLVFGTDEIYFGPLVDAEVWRASASPAHRPPPVFRAEAEIAFRLAADLPPGSARSSDPSDHFDAWAPALEAPYSAVENLPQAGLRALLADRCAAGALFLGRERPNIFDSDIDSELAICAGGEVLAASRARDGLVMAPLAAAMAFLDQAKVHGVPLKRGQWVATGGITSCVDLPLDGRAITLRLNGDIEFTLDLDLAEGEGV